MTTMGARLLLGLTIVTTTAVASAGFLVLGSPAKQRELRLDNKRVEDLGEIKAAVHAYQLQHNTLPPTLHAIEDGWSRPIPRDPHTSQPYEFTVLDSGRYELCAVFHHPSDGATRSWEHRAGRHCFTRSTQKLQNAFED